MNQQVTFDKSTIAPQALLALWYGTKYLGLGFLQQLRGAPTLEDAIKQLQLSTNIDYFFGKPIKTSFKNFPTLDPYLYDRDAGKGMMEHVSKNLMK